ncbi:MAG: methyltransferase domain-containing protein [Anaerolineae bacterium]|nr:methyltransferase domain-containing protein [Anaerolineae bacterium]
MPLSNASTQAIVNHYNRYDESERLKHDIGPLELVRTQELALRYLPAAPSVVVDVGGATGVYAFWLASLGYEAHLVDIVPRHIEQAREAAQTPGSPQLASARVGDARALDFADNFADAVWLHGPLYHLTDRAERLMVLAEALRILRPGGVLLAFAITRYAGLIYGLTKGLVFDPAYHAMIANEVRTGRRENPPPHTFTFPNAFFHLPEELRAEIRKSGLDHETILGILGPAWLVPDLDKSWQDPAEREVILDIARLTENEPALGPRLMAVARKPVSTRL